MTQPSKTDMTTLADGQQALVELPVTEQVLEKLEREVETRIANILEAGDPLSGDEAVQAWIEKHVYRRLRRRLTQRVQMGQTAGANLQPYMDHEEQPDGQE